MEKKGITIYKKVVFFMLVVEFISALLLWLGYSTALDVMNSDSPERYIRNYMIFCGIAMVFIIGSVTYFAATILSAIHKGFKQATDIANKLTEGDTDIVIENNKKDEFGLLLEDFRRLIEATKKQSHIADAVAEGDLTVDVEVRSDKDTLGLALRKMVDRNLHSLSNISESAYQVMTSSSQVASASEALAQGSTEQASAIEEITSSISEIAVKTKQNASQATEAAELVSNAIGYVKKGNEQMEEMMSAMEDINRSSESISKIIKVIDDIAFQTNILALNAAVEAARAGEAGKGFAVVAEEVRNLAAKSAAAASETAELIEDSINKVSAGSKIADDTASALEAITQGVSKSGTLIAEIAESSNYQATAVAQINQAIGQVSQVVQTNSATSEQCAAASEELSNQAIHMREMLSIYNLGEVKMSSRSRKEIGSVAKSSDYDLYENNPNEEIISLGDGFGKY
ncbi:MAG: methyl-accepting chemotaxis protein [Agathobacter sp.]|nr:methyl-accepting chemotaxis protein [Agathobacter sp.]